MLGPGFAIVAFENPHPVLAFPEKVKLTGQTPVRSGSGGGGSAGTSSSEAAAAGTNVNPNPTAAPTTTATIARLAAHAQIRIISLPLTPRPSLHHVEGRRHGVMVETAELRAPNRVIAGLERLEPVRVRVARDDVDLEQEIRKIERVRDVEGTQDEFDGQTGFHAKRASCVQRCECPRAVEPRAVPDVGDVEIPEPLVCVDLDDHIRLRRDRVGRDEPPKLRQADHDQGGAPEDP